MENNNYSFWKMAFDKKIADIDSVAKATLSNQITVDEFQKITGLNYIPYVANGTENFISAKDIMADLANAKLENITKNRLINDLTNQVASNRLEIMTINNKTVKEGN